MAARLSLMLLGLAATAGTAYPSWTRMRALQREGRQEWDATGVRAGSAAFTCGLPADTAVLFVHGFASSPSIFRFMAPALAEQGYACRAMRLPGFAERLELHAWTWTRPAGGTRWPPRSRRCAPLIRRVWVVGHSMGGTLALDYALEHPGELDGLVLIAPLITVSTRRSLGLPSQHLFRVRAPGAAGGCDPRHGLPGGPERAGRGDRRVARPLPADRDVRRDVPHDRPRARPRPRAGPAGADGPARPRQGGQPPGRTRLLRGPRLRAANRCATRPRSGHVVPLDYGWNEVVRQMDAFARAGEGT
jgi:pimeloyl-ACP methyl ester carboxylesterase